MTERGGLASGAVVAIVDDDEAIGRALARLIRTFGYRPQAFGSGESLLAVFSDLQPACVLTDIQMPGMNGLELVRELHLRQPNLPIMLMTAYPSLTNRDLALSVGAQEYLTKPLDDERLEQWLLKVTARK
jgi:FixJ family two-component response regulator